MVSIVASASVTRCSIIRGSVKTFTARPVRSARRGYPGRRGSLLASGGLVGRPTTRAESLSPMVRTFETAYVTGRKERPSGRGPPCSFRRRNVQGATNGRPGARRPRAARVGQINRTGRGHTDCCPHGRSYRPLMMLVRPAAETPHRFARESIVCLVGYEPEDAPAPSPLDMAGAGDSTWPWKLPVLRGGGAQQRHELLVCSIVVQLPGLKNLPERRLYWHQSTRSPTDDPQASIVNSI